jgi:hypothetical protein
MTERDEAAAKQAGEVYGCDLPPDGSLADEGWEWRCNADARRTREMVDTYRELGFEVRLEPVDVEALCTACDGCKDAFAAANAVYVRRKPAAA